MKLFEYIKNWWNKRKRSPVVIEEKQDSRIYSYKPYKMVSSINEIPEKNLNNEIYLVTRGGLNRWVVFDCPGGHGKRIEVNLMKSRYPCWTATVKNETITLHPSVAVDDDICNCHFFLRNNTVSVAYYE